jgi:phage tail sheath protein FI
MSNALLSSKVSIQEEEPRTRTIDAVQTSIAAMVGIAERGPIGVATLVTSFDEYRDIFGGYTTDAEMTTAAEGFFDNEGQFLYVTRTVHFADPSNPATKVSLKATINLLTAAGGPTAGSVTSNNTETFLLADGQTVVVDVDTGGNATATFNAAAAALTASNTETYALANGETLTFRINGGALQTVTFTTAAFANIALATALEVSAVINAGSVGIQADVDAGASRITTDRQGTGASIEIVGGTAQATLGFAIGTVNGTGDVADITAVTAAEAKTVIEADVPGCTVNDLSGAVQIVSNTTGLSSSIQVDAASTADGIFGFDNALHVGTTGAAVPTLQVDGLWDGAYANQFQLQVAAATSGESDRFNLTLLQGGLIAEIWPNVSMDDNAERYVEDVVNLSNEKSKLISVVDLDVSSAQRPANGISANMTGGDDGLTGLVDNDFIGDSTGKTGIRALDTVQDVSILGVPGQATGPIQNAMINYCESTRNGSMFSVLDSPAGASATDIITYVETTALLLGLSEFGAMYWPRVKVLNPLRGVFGNVDNIVVAPSGHIMGVYARTDAARPGGIYDPPAGIEEGQLLKIVGFETDEVFDEARRDLVFPKRINILTSFTGAPRHIDGSRCLKSNGNFPFVAQRRGAIFIEQSIKNGTEFARNKNNTDKLRREVERTIRGFLKIQMNNNAFASNDPDLAFFVDFSEKIQTPAKNRMDGRVGLAFNEPAEFIVIRFSKDTRAIEQAAA